MTETDFTSNPIFDIDVADLEGVLTTYKGKDPKPNVIMDGVLKSMYLTRDRENTPMLKVIYQAVGGDYDGYAAWDNISLKSSAAFKWGPLCEDVLRVSVEDLKKRTKLNPDPDSETGAGRPVLSVGKVKIDGEMPVGFSMRWHKFKDDDGDVQKVLKLAMVFNNQA